MEVVKSGIKPASGAKALLYIADSIGPAKAVPLLQSPHGGVFPQLVKLASFCKFFTAQLNPCPFKVGRSEASGNQVIMNDHRYFVLILCSTLRQEHGFGLTARIFRFAGENEAAGAVVATAVAFEEIGGPDTLSHRR